MSELGQHTVTLEAGGRSLSAWSSITISRSLESAASSFQLAAFQARPGQVVVQPQSAGVVRLDGLPILTGYADDVDVSGTVGGSSVVVTGRSRTCDLVDCSLPLTSPRRWTAATVETIAAALAAEYGVSVVPEVASGLPLARFAVQDGETVHDAIDRLASLRSLLVTDDEFGNLVLTRASSLRHAGTLAEGVNLSSWTVSHKGSQRFSQYAVKTQRRGSVTVPAALAASVVGLATDDAPRTRLLVIDGQGHLDPAGAQERARYEMLARYGRSLTVTCSVPGWRDAAGDVWRPNRLVRIRIPSSLLDADLLVSAVTLTQGPDGTRADLTLQPPEAFSLYTPSTPGPRGVRAPKGYQLSAADVAAAVKRAEAYK